MDISTLEGPERIPSLFTEFTGTKAIRNPDFMAFQLAPVKASVGIQVDYKHRNK